MKSRSTRDRLASIASWSGAVAIVVAGTFSCVSYPIVGARDGSLSAMFAPFAPRATRDSIATAAAGTYIDRILADRDSVLDRWPDRADDPIRVWIDSVPGAASDQAGFAAAVNEAFDDWAAVGIPVRFRFLSSPQHAEIHVRWIDRLANKTGSTSWRATRDGWLSA